NEATVSPRFISAIYFILPVAVSVHWRKRAQNRVVQESQSIRRTRTRRRRCPKEAPRRASQPECSFLQLQLTAPLPLLSALTPTRDRDSSHRCPFESMSSAPRRTQ